MSYFYNGTSMKRRAKGLSKFVRYSEVSLYIEVFFHFLYYRWAGVKRIVRYTQDFRYTEVPLSKQQKVYFKRPM